MASAMADNIIIFFIRTNIRKNPQKSILWECKKVCSAKCQNSIFYNPKHQYTKGLIRSIPRIDTKEHERLIPIEGTPVDLLNPPKGCPFAPRCEECMKICLREMPPVTNFGEVHYTQCWLNQKEELEKGAANE